MNVATKICIFAALVASYDLLLGYTGSVSFAHTMFYGIGSYAIAIALYSMGPSWTAVATGVAIGLPLAILLAVAVGVLELIPLFGPASSIALVVLTAIQQVNLFEILGLIVFAIALRISIDQLLGPAVLGRAVRVHPVVIIFSFLAGAVLFGVVGLILAVPVAASIKIILASYYGEPIAKH